MADVGDRLCSQTVCCSEIKAQKDGGRLAATRMVLAELRRHLQMRSARPCCAGVESAENCYMTPSSVHRIVIPAVQKLPVR